RHLFPTQVLGNSADRSGVLFTRCPPLLTGSPGWGSACQCRPRARPPELGTPGFGPASHGVARDTSLYLEIGPHGAQRARAAASLGPLQVPTEQNGGLLGVCGGGVGPSEDG